MKCYLDDFEDINTTSLQPSAVSWQISDDANFSNILDEVIEDTKDIYIWMADFNVNAYKAVPLYVRVKLHYTNSGVMSSSDWYTNVVEVGLHRVVRVRKNGVVVSEYKDGKKVW